MKRVWRYKINNKSRSSKSGARIRNRQLSRIGVVGTFMAALLLTGCTSSAPSALVAKNTSSNNPAVVHEQIVIQTGKMDGKPGWPRFVPSNITFPDGSKVVLTIVNYDDGTAPLPATAPYGNVWGSDPTFGVVTGGSETVDGKVTTKIANNLVSHTFTVPALLVNIPIPAVPSGQQTTTVVFTFQVNKTGKFLWLCEAPCGSGPMGMSGAMETDGWMRGFVNVT